LFGSLRNRIQLIIFVLTLCIGFQFYLFVLQASGKGTITIPRPEGVEAFLPIGALMGWKYYFSTGIWDTIHPTSMVILLFAVLVSFIFRKVFCSWFCPVGTLSEWTWKIGEKVLGQTYRLPKWVDFPLRNLKYLLLAFFVYVVSIMNPAEIGAFLESPYYKIADVKMLHFFTKMSLLTAMILLGLIVLSVFVRNFWCRYVCPYGALLGIFAIISPTRIQRNPDTCTNCGKCHRVCPFHLPVDKKLQIMTPVCSGCMDCVNECSSPDTLGLGIVGTKKTLSTIKVGFWVIVFWAALVYLATVTGHWKSQLSESEFRMWLNQVDSPEIGHPSTRIKP
jgi:polyferredoxin